MSISKVNEILILVEDLQIAIDFYERIFERKITDTFEDRWANLHGNGNLLFIVNKSYDRKHDIPKTSHETDTIHGNTCIPVYLTDNIDSEHERISKISDDVSEICYLNIIMPYRFFTFKDPEGNIIEIGQYPENKN